MESRHVINEQLKRLEPKETLCQYCNTRHSDKMERNHFVGIFNIEDRTNIIVYSSVKYKKLLIGIPRCTQCFLIHKKSSYNSWIISLLAGASLIALGFLLFGLYGIFSAILLFALTMIAPMFITDILIKKAGVLTPRDGAMKDPLIQDMVISGWTLTQPSARG